MYYSEEQYLEAHQELLGDGYSNEFQRAYAVSQLGRSVINERAQAAALTAAGKYVVCAEQEVCCNLTDALLGYDFVIIKVCEYLDEAETLIAGSDYVFLFQPELPGLLPTEQSTDTDDEIPF
jgi:hypothetical protein